MIHRAKFQNFKALRDVEITFDSRLTVLVGPNGSGKTSVLQGMHALSQLAMVSGGDADVALPRLAEYLSLGAPESDLAIAITGQRAAAEYSSQITTRLPTDIVGSLSAQYRGRSNSWNIGSHFDGGRWHESFRMNSLSPDEAKWFDATALIRFSASQLATPTLIQNYPPRVAKDGYGLAATLSHIKSKYPERHEAIIEAFRRVIPNVKGVRFDKERVPETQFYGDVLLVDYKGVEGVKAAHVSSGTLFALGLLTVALGPDSANVILLDDLDHGLHPKAQMELIAVFRKLIAQNPDLQIIATAHSPYILQRLEWNEVRVTELRDDGSAICARLEDHPEVERWREAMTPGEFWSHTGDDWVKKLEKPTVEPPQPEPVTS